MRRSPVSDMSLATLATTAVVLAGAIVSPVLAQTPRPAEFKVEDVASVTTVAPGSLPIGTIAFADHRKDQLVDPVSGLIRFADWARTRPVHKQLLSLHPGYDEPTVTTTVNGVPKTQKRRLHMYVAEARFEIARRAEAIDLARYVDVAVLSRLDPSITHRPIAASDVAANADAKLSAHHPARSWCEPSSSPVLCLQSRYKLEGKLPTAILLLNKLRDSGKQIADFLEFQSELRIVPLAEIDQAAVAKITGIDTQVAAALEQNIVQVNQVMQFGKFFAVLQPSPIDPARTIATAFVALAVESDLFEKRKELESVPVMRNMVPAQVLAGNSSFNTGNSISAGLPVYARNRMKAIAEVLSPR